MTDDPLVTYRYQRKRFDPPGVVAQRLDQRLLARRSLGPGLAKRGCRHGIDLRPICNGLAPDDHEPAF